MLNIPPSEITYILKVYAPNLEAIGERLVATLEHTAAELVRLNEGHTMSAQNLEAALMAIQAEVAQMAAATVTQEQIDALAAGIGQAADNAHTIAGQIASATDMIRGIVPDAPPPPPPPVEPPPSA